MIAEIQHFTYKEFFPLIIGDNSLAPLKNVSYYTGYDSSINPSMYNEFSVAAFRFGHSLIRQQSNHYDVNNNQIKNSSYNLETTIQKSDVCFRFVLFFSFYFIKE